MKRVSGIKVSKYTPAPGYFYLVEEDRDGFHAWFGMEGYGRVSFAFGAGKSCTSREGFLVSLENMFEDDRQQFLDDYGDDLQAMCDRGFIPSALAR